MGKKVEMDSRDRKTNDRIVKIFQDESKGILRRYGWGGTLSVMGRMLLLYIKNPAYREFVKGVRQNGVTPVNLEEYFGYGLFVGHKN